MTRITILPNDGQKFEVDASWLPILYRTTPLALPITDKDSLAEMIRYCKASSKMDRLQRGPWIVRRERHASGADHHAWAMQEALNRDFLQSQNDWRLDCFQHASSSLNLPRLLKLVYDERKRRMVLDGMTEAQILYEIGPDPEEMGF